MKSEFLHLLIDEEIYRIKEPTKSMEPQDEPQPPVETAASVKFAFISDSTEESEKELLSRIIGACQLKEEDYQIVDSKSNTSFQKAIIFTNVAEAFYLPMLQSDKQVLYSKPLDQLATSKDEKAKLWAALKAFVSG